MSGAPPVSEEGRISAGDAFLDQIMRAIVQQFYEAPQIVVMTPDPITGQMPYVPQRSTPVQIVSERLLQAKGEELLGKILAAMNLDDLAERVAAQMSKAILTTSPQYSSEAYRAKEKRKELADRVDQIVAEKLASDVLANMKNCVEREASEQAPRDGQS